METTRLQPLSGIVFVALFALTWVGVAGETPGSDASGNELVAFYADSWRQSIAPFVLAASTPFLVMFGASLARTGAPARGEHSAWRLVLMAGTAVTAAVLLLRSVLHLALTDGADQGIPESALQAVNTVAGSMWIAVFAALGLMMLGAAGCLIPSPGASRWLGWTALLLGIALFVPAADFLAALLTAIWIIVASVMLARASGRSAPESRLERGVSASVHP
jgi:hypothetical protein